MFLRSGELLKTLCLVSHYGGEARQSEQACEERNEAVLSGVNCDIGES